MAGWDWIKQAFELFKKDPLIWILLIVILFALNILGQFIPIMGSLAMSLLYAVFFAGFMYGCAELDRGEHLEIGHLFSGFRQNTKSLVGIGALYLLVIIAFGILMVPLMFVVAGGVGVFTNPGSLNVEQLMSPEFLIVLLVIFAIAIPIGMAFLFAPALVALGGVPVMSSLRMSFMGCLKNILPSLIFGIALMVLAVIACIPLFLGWLVLIPTSIAAIYATCRAIYTN